MFLLMILNAIKLLNIMKNEVSVSPNLYSVIMYRDILCGYKSLESVSNHLIHFSYQTNTNGY